MIDITLYFPQGMFASTAIGPMEVFRHSGSLWNICHGQPAETLFRVTTASLDGGPVECDGALQIHPNASIHDITNSDLILIPSTGLALEDVAERNRDVVPWLHAWRQRGTAIAAVCSGTGLLAATGMLDGKRATTHWGLAARFRELYPQVRWTPECMVTEDDNLFCGGGVHASLDLSLYLVERFCGHEIALQSARAMLIETTRAWQAGFAIAPLKLEHTDASVHRAQEWMHANFHRGSAMEAARHAGMSERNFARRFKLATGDSPLEYQQKLRVSAAKRLLENPSLTMEEVGHAVGYGDPSFFRTVFHRYAGCSPAAYRKRLAIAS
ncbi:GlxA family transcriptional regulator [Terriglobus tenax]|uniref:GlxA family transcriptional regulator n=1 Tax=Terriglobus tenax TaxID=1111115 RepID=UPI0021E0C3D2|nr:helix-turn-helix domain-containing protein [Terriglobus tenax]